ncbi:MAG: nickel/cobalt efflux transporter RcnA [Methylacidiphilales bacterium]|nr:nickel/cobalt efflux transporter RcnA [Candidatus Methylacidiphilales bacterium]
MPTFAELIQQSTAQAWLFIPSAVLLGALHGLEPGHSKTMMAAFIVAIRGTVGQAVLLGLAATFSHTIVVWAIALGGLHLWQGLDAEVAEPYLQLASAAIIIGIALWMIWRTWIDQQHAVAYADHPHQGQGCDARHHSHGADRRRIDTGHGAVALEVFEHGVPPRWRLHVLSEHPWTADDVRVTTRRLDGSEQVSLFVDKDGLLESSDTIPEPHAFTTRLSLGHGDHSHDYDLSFSEGHDHGGELPPEVAAAAWQDAHERAHANDIKDRFAGRNVTTGQLVLFGLTGELIPCPAAVTVLLLCLQLKEIPLGAVLVLCFSIGLALTLVAVGVAAALGVRHAANRLGWFNALARRAPYASGALIILVGLYVGVTGWFHLPTA